MTALRVLEWVRDPDGVWNMPGEHVAALARDFPQVRFDDPGTREEADALLPSADVVLGYALRPRNFANAARVRWVHSTAAGVGHLLFPELVESDIVVTNARGIHARSMAEHVLGVMLAFTRRLHVARDAQHERRWTQAGLWRAEPGFAELAGSTLGIVGFGQIGRAIGQAARAFGMRVLAVRRRPQADPAPADEQWGPERLDELLECSDWVVLAAPHTPETDRLLGADRIARMKPGARLVNIGRGALLDEAALVEALRSGRLAGAALDVTETEPLPADSPLWSMPEVIVTPHISGVGPRFWERITAQFAGNLRRFLDGRPLENLVDKRVGY
jgi:phosphoglycerate dehydrogenase-like enzyme